MWVGPPLWTAESTPYYVLRGNANIVLCFFETAVVLLRLNPSSVDEKPKTRRDENVLAWCCLLEPGVDEE